jgi:transposase
LLREAIVQTAIADREVVPEEGEPEVIFCVDEFGPLNLQPRPAGSGPRSAARTLSRAASRGRGCAPPSPAPKACGTYFAAYELGENKLFGHIEPHKTRGRFLEFCRYLRSLYPPALRIAIICDNFSPHLTTARDSRVGVWGSANNIEIAYTPTNSSWLNRVEAQFTALRYFALDGTDDASHK